MDDDEKAIAAFVAEVRAGLRRDHPEIFERREEAAPSEAEIVRDDDGLSDSEEEHLHGRCHLIAVALHEATGLPLGAFLDETWVETNDGGVEMVVLVHAFVVDGEDAIDIRGRIPMEDVLDEFDFNEPWLVNPTVSDLLVIGEGRKNVGKRNPRWLEAKQHADALADRLGLYDKVSKPRPR